MSKVLEKGHSELVEEPVQKPEDANQFGWVDENKGIEKLNLARESNNTFRTIWAGSSTIEIRLARGRGLDRLGSCKLW